MMLINAEERTSDAFHAHSGNVSGNELSGLVAGDGRGDEANQVG
jgi:hypothetical protein